MLDNDFVEFPRGPLPSLQVTAAHEFFHAIQFAYDATEDRWLMEATATWAEERYADDIDDNRQYLKHGQLGRPRNPLDEYDAFGQGHYGNWVFFERLSQRYGVEAVHRSGTRPTRRRAHPTCTPPPRRQGAPQADTTFAQFYGRFAAGNQLPEEFYEEGCAYRTAPWSARSASGRACATSPSAAASTTSQRVVPLRASGLAARTLAAAPGGERPPKAAGTAATVLVESSDGDAKLIDVRLSARGSGARRLPSTSASAPSPSC